jgi:hypothetical protein
MTDEDLKKEIKIIVADYAAACLLDSTIRSELGV